MNENNGKIPDILKEAISIEIYGMEYYSIFSELVEDENAKSLLKGLARDEGEHREYLEKEYKKLTGKPVDIKILDRENREKARQIFPESLEPLGIEETKDVLKLGIRTEERSIKLYSNSAKRTDAGGSKELFLKLAVFEKGHKELLEDALYYLEQEGSWYGYSPPTLEG
ncbi:MAG: ferritin family protein [Candidatus Methanoperedens sp.]|nr:ferritin family protein [Candidatus Methanoperedens sp.]